MLVFEATSTRKRLAVGALLLFMAVAFGFLALLSLSQKHGVSWWNGFHTILVDAAVPESSVINNLTIAGVKEILSESTAPILVSDWSGLITIPLAQTRDLLVPGDPRLDKYLKHIGDWFDARVGDVPYRAYYIKEGSRFGSSASSDRVLERGLADFKGQYIIPDNSSVKKPSSVDTLSFAGTAFCLLTACFIGALIGKPGSSFHGNHTQRLHRGKLDRVAFRFFLVLPWIVLAVGGYSTAALAALWGLAIAETADKLDFPLDEFRQNSGLKIVLKTLSLQLPPGLVLLGVAILASFLVPAQIPSLALACMGSVLALFGYAFLTTRPSERRRFIPLPIDGRKYFSRRPKLASANIRATLASLIVVAWGLNRLFSVSLEPVSTSEFSLPCPHSIPGSIRPSLSETRLKSTSENRDILPGLASYLEHRAIQEAIPYVRVGEIRLDPFATLRFPEPSTTIEANTTTVSEVVGIDFSDDWVHTVYASVPPLSIEGMLLQQHSAMVVSIGSVAGRSPRPLAPIEYLMYTFLLVPLLGRLFFGVPLARGVASSELRQEA